METQGISRGQTLVDRYEFWQKPANSKIMTKVDTRLFPKVLTELGRSRPSSIGG